MHPVAQRRYRWVLQSGIVERRVPGAAPHDHRRGGMREGVFGGEIIRRIGVAHDRRKPVGRDVDPLDLVRLRVQRGQRLLKAIERRVDRVAARIEPEIIAGDVPNRAEVFEQVIWREAASDQIAEGLLDRVFLRSKTGTGQFGGERSGKAAHAAGDIERRRTCHCVGIARRQQQRGRNARGPADPGRIEPVQPRSRGGCSQQRHLAVLVRQWPRREAARQPRNDIVPEDKGGEHVAARASEVLADGQYSRQHLHRRLAGNKTQPLAQLDGPPGNAVQQRRSPRIMRRPAPRKHRGPGSGSPGESVPQLAHLGTLRARQDDPQGIEQHQLCMALHGLRNILPLRLRDKLRQGFDLQTH